jgi:DNA-binding PadR family transcriptional regulator
VSVRNAILGLLAQRPRHGYLLRTAFEALVGGEGVWDVKPAQIYSTLARLEQAGLVRAARLGGGAGPEKRVYAITRAGRRELSGWYETGVEDDRQRDEFFVKLMLAIGAGQADPYRVIQGQRGRLYQELHDLTGRREAADPARELAQILLLDKKIMHVEADLRWLEMIEARLDEMRRQPPREPAPRPRGRPRKRPAPGEGADDVTDRG